MRVSGVVNLSWNAPVANFFIATPQLFTILRVILGKTVESRSPPVVNLTACFFLAVEGKCANNNENVGMANIRHKRIRLPAE